VPGLGLRLGVGLAGIVSRKRVGGGEDDSRTVWRFSGSTAEVSHESNPSSVERARDSRGPLARSREVGRWEDRRLTERRRVLEVMGRMACEREVRMELMVSVAERPPLDPGGVGESNDALPRSLVAETGVVSWYRTVLIRGADRLPWWVEISGCDLSVRPTTKCRMKKTSCVANASPNATDEPTRKSPAFQPKMVLSGSSTTRLRYTILDADTAEATVHNGKPAPNQTPRSHLRLGAHGAIWERLRKGMATKMTASRIAAPVAVVLTDDARSAGERARMASMANMAVVGRNATAPSAAGTVRGIAIAQDSGVPR
jgi:hypothetical protein